MNPAPLTSDVGRMFWIFLADPAGGWTTDVLDEMSPWSLRLTGGGSSLEVVFDGPAVIGMRLRGPAKLASIHSILTVVRPMDSDGRAWWVQLNGGRVRFLLEIVSGDVSIKRDDRSVEIVHSGSECVLRFEEFEFLPPAPAGRKWSFDAAVERSREGFPRFVRTPAASRRTTTPWPAPACATARIPPGVPPRSSCLPIPRIRAIPPVFRPTCHASPRFSPACSRSSHSTRCRRRSSR